MKQYSLAVRRYHCLERSDFHSALSPNRDSAVLLTVATNDLATEQPARAVDQDAAVLPSWDLNDDSRAWLFCQLTCPCRRRLQ